MFTARSATALLVGLSIFLLSGTSLQAQARFQHNPASVPIYSSKPDSIKLHKIEQEITALENSTPADSWKIDSLLSIHWTLYQEFVIGFRKIYSSDKDHISLDSLLRVKDFSTVKKISISHYQDKNFPETVLQCQNLESLELLNTRFERLPGNLNSLSKLRVVKIYNNKSKGALKLKKNRFVTTLKIRSDNQKTLPKSYRRWNELVTLDLAENFLTRFPMGARHNKKLKDLNLQENKLTLKKKLKPHPYVEKLALQHNQISHVPASIHVFKNLRKLNFNYNKITTVHQSIRLLNNLEQLSFYHNQLSAIPSGVYEIASLKELDLFYNQIETIEPTLGHWKRLTMLYLSHNKILSLPENIGDLSSLQGLYIWDNRIGTLPETVGNIKNLRFLWANHNYLKLLPASILDLDKMEELDISHNFITEIPEAIFDFNRLKILSLVNNPWNEKTMDFIPRRAWQLRAKNVFVHISDGD